MGLEVKLLKLQDAKDPDEFIKKFGADRFRRTLEESRTKFEYNFENILHRYDLLDPQEKIKALMALCELTASFYSSAERDVYITEIAKKLGVEANSVRADVDRLIRKKKSEAKREQTQKIHRDAAGFADKINPDFVKNPAAARAEETVLGLLLLYEEHRKAALCEPLSLVEEDFYTAFGRKVFAYIAAAYEKGESPDLLDEYFDPDEVGRITKMKVSRMQLTDNGPAVLEEGVRSLRALVRDQRAQEGGMTLSALSDLINRRRGDE